MREFIILVCLLGHTNSYFLWKIALLWISQEHSTGRRKFLNENFSTAVTLDGCDTEYTVGAAHLMGVMSLRTPPFSR